MPLWPGATAARNSTQARPRYRLLLVDDQPEVCAAIRDFVGEEHDVVGEVHRGCEVADSVRDLHPDIVLLDVSMPDRSGFSVLRQLAKTSTVKVLFVTQHSDPRYIEEARREGAVGYVLKSQMRNLLAAVRQAGEGGPFFQSSLAV